LVAEKEFIVKSREIIVTDADMEKLSRLIRTLQESLFRDQRQLDALDQALQSAEVRPPRRIPKSVVRMSSSIRVRDCDTGKEELYTLVFPEAADISKGLISVLAPVGIALLGHKKGEIIEARVPGGTRRLKVQQVRFKCEARKRSIEDGARGLIEPLAA
jgi:regulator of nucleoside diphosphate kinase